ncbi:hypothetical protein RS030_172583 [Cryptosporidium xiaoi]|uniref:HEAT repeat family protein n=1 Tax=Cryptosporidium xiaoi TaxID=659607 RepID=A0AAV9XZN5_9CRYT
MERLGESHKYEGCLTEQDQIIPDLKVFSDNIGESNMSQKINYSIQILCENSHILNVKTYKNYWKEFIIKVGTWMGNNNNVALFQNTINILSCSRTQVVKIWLLNGLLKSNKVNVDSMKDSIYASLKNNIICEYINYNNCIIESEYLYLLKVVSNFINNFIASKWRDWIYRDLNSFGETQRFDNYQKFIIDISICYINNKNDDMLKSDIIECLNKLASPIISCCSELTLRNIIRTFIHNQVILDSFVSSILRQLKRTTKPTNVLVLLEFFIKEVNRCNNVGVKFDSIFNDIINSLVDHISNSVLIIISPNSEQNQENVKIIRTSLNICYLLIFGDIEKEAKLFSLLEDIILSINVTKTSVQMKISFLLLANTILLRLVNLRVNMYSRVKLNDNNGEYINIGSDFISKLSRKSQEALLLTMETKIPIASPQYSDHFKLLSAHTNSLVFVLTNNLESSYSNEYLSKIQLNINDSSLTDTSKLIIISSFVNALYLIKIINYYTSRGSSNICFPKIVRDILFSENISNLFSSALNKTNSLKKLSVLVLGQMLSIRDILNENDIFNRLNIYNNIKNSSLPFPKLNTLLGGTFNFFPKSHINAEINAFIVIMEIISNSKYKGSSCNNYLPTLNLHACMQLFKDWSIVQSIENYITLLIQAGRVLSFSSLNDEFYLRLIQYSVSNIEIFQGATLISGLKRPFIEQDCEIIGGYSLIDYIRKNQVFKEETVLYNLIVSFTIVLGSFYSINISNIDDGSYENEINNLINLPNMNLRGVWILISSIMKSHVNDHTNEIKYQYLVMFLLCSYHPLMQNNKYKNNDIKYENTVNEISCLFNLRNMLNNYEFRSSLIQFYIDLTYLPLSDATGFRKACLNMLSNKYIMESAQFVGELTDKLRDNYYNSLDFLTSNMPPELGDFVVSDPNSFYEFNISDNIANTDCIEDIQEVIFMKISSFMNGDKKFEDFSGIYELIRTSKWLENNIMNYLDENSNTSSSKTGVSGLSSSQLLSVTADKSKNKDVLSASNNSKNSVNINTTSAFAIAKLRKTQTENKSKSGKSSSDKGVNQITNVGSGNKTGEQGSSVSTGAPGGNMTKKEIVDQQIKKQNMIRNDIFKIVSRIKCGLEIFIRISENLSSLLSCSPLELTNNNTIFKELEIKLSDIVFTMCNKMIEFKPLKFYTIELMEYILSNIVKCNGVFRKNLIEYLSFSDETKNNNTRRRLLNSILESFTISENAETGKENDIQFSNNGINELSDSYSSSALICIISKALCNLCENNEDNLEQVNNNEALSCISISEEIQILSKLILYISLSTKNGNIILIMKYLCNLLYLYIFSLGDLVVLDQYITPIKHMLMYIKVRNSDELELVSSLLIFPYLPLRVLILELILGEINRNNVTMSYYSYVNIRISNEVKSLIDEENLENEELSRIVNISNELVNKYIEDNKTNKLFEKRLIDDLLTIQTSPVITLKQQCNISKVLLSEFSESNRMSGICDVINVLLDKLDLVKKEWLDLENTILSSPYSLSKLIYDNNWPILLRRSLINGMVPKTVSYLDSIIPAAAEDLNLREGRIVLRIQKRNSLKGIFMCLRELIKGIGDENYELIESCIRFILTQVIDSTILKDASTGELDFKSNNEAKEKKVVKNISINRNSDNEISNRIIEYDRESLKLLMETLIDFFVALSNNKYINNSASKILATLQNLSIDHKPVTNNEEFYNTLAFSIGCMASCCSIDDPIVKGVTYKIVGELLNGRLCKKMRDDMPLLTDIPNEYRKILPKLFRMLCCQKMSTECGDEYMFRISNIDDLQDIYSEYVLSESKDGYFDIEKSFSKEKELGENKIDGIILGYRILEVSLSIAIFSEESRKRIGSAHVFGSISEVIGVRKMNNNMIFRLISDILFDYSDNNSKSKQTLIRLEGVLNCIGSLSMYLGVLIEPYIIKYLNNIIKIISENDQRIRYYSEKITEILVTNLSKYGIKQVLPIVIEGIEVKQWRIKIAILRLLVILSNNSPNHLSFFLPKAIEIINKAASDSHQNVSKAAKETLYEIIELVKNPEVKSISEEFVKTLIDPTENNIKRSLLTLKSVTFIHAVDTTTLSLILPVLLKPIQERGQTELKKDSLHILSSLLLLLSHKSDIDPFIKQIENSVHMSLTDPIPEIRILTAKLCRSLVSVIGQEKSSSLIEWHFNTLSSEVGQTLKSGVSASLAEILSVFGIEKFKKILPYILSQVCLTDNVSRDDKVFEVNVGGDNTNSLSSRKEGYIGLFVYLPQAFGEELGYLMPEILPKLLYCFGDESDIVRETALKACKSLVMHFGSGHAGYILQPLEDGLANNNWRVRLNCCILLGILLNMLIKGQLDSTGNSLCNDTNVLEDAGFSLQRRSYILAAIYMARNDENMSVKNNASALWKSLVQNTPQTLKDILPILIRRIINSLSNSGSTWGGVTDTEVKSNENDCINNDGIVNNNVYYNAVQCLKDLLDKFGNSLQSQLLPIFYQNFGGVLDENGINYELLIKKGEMGSDLMYTNPNVSARVGACVGLLELLKVIKKNDLKSSTNSFLPLIRMGLSDTEFRVRLISVECLDVISADNSDVLFKTIDWLLDDILLPNSENGEDSNDSKLSSIELIIQLPHTGIVAKIFPRVSSGSMDLKKIRIIRSMSKIPSQNKLRSSLFDIVPLLLNAYSIGFENTSESVDKGIQESAYDAMNSIVQSLDEQGMETYVTIIFEIIRNNTPDENLTVSGRYQISNSGISNLSQLENSDKVSKRVKSLDFLRLSLFSNSTIYETSYQTLIRYIIPIAICDISEEARVSASKTFQTFVNFIPRKLTVKSCSVMREAIGKLVYDPLSHQKNFSSEDNKLIGNMTWDKEVKARRVVINEIFINQEDGKYYISSATCSERKRLGDDMLFELVKSNNKLLDSITSLYIQGMTFGTVDSKEECAMGLYEVINISLVESIKPITVKLVGPLIRLISDKTTTGVVRVSLLNNLSLLIELCGMQLRPLLPQIQTILIKYIIDASISVRKSCVAGIGNLYKLLGNRSEMLLSDLCSLIAKQNNIDGNLDIIYSILSSIYEAIKPNNYQTNKSCISNSLRDKIIGMTLSFMDGYNSGSGNGDLPEISSKILCLVLVEHCAEDEIREILLPMANKDINNDNLDLYIRDSKNLMSIINCSLETADGWQKLCMALKDDDKLFRKMVSDEILDSGYKYVKYIDCDTSQFNENKVEIIIHLPFGVKNNGLSWLYLSIVDSILKSIILSSNNSNIETKKLFVETLYKLCKYVTLIGNNDDNKSLNLDVIEFSISIIVQTLFNITVNSNLMYNQVLTSNFDTSVILTLQKLCELLIDSCYIVGDKETKSNRYDNNKLLSHLLKDIDNNIRSYINSIFGTTCDNRELDSNAVLISLVTITSVQTINSKNPILKLKSEHILVRVIGHVYSQLRNSDANIRGFNINDDDLETDEYLSDQDVQEKKNLSIVQCIIKNLSDLISPKKISTTQINYLIEYSKRVLVKKISNS